MRLGIDVGGTNTDAVLVDRGKVLAGIKEPTTRNPNDGIVSVVKRILKENMVAPDRILGVMLGTTHFTNAFVQRKNLDQVGIIRLSLPAARGLPPMIDWPDEAISAVNAQVALVRGGHEFDGRPIAPLDELAVSKAARDFRESGMKAIAITGIFSPVIREGEVRAAEIVRNELPDAAITLSSDLGRVGLIERENAAIMNASLASLAQTTIDAFQQAFAALGINAPFYISQNDGTLMSVERARAFPVLTFSSGPTNSIRGASFLSGRQEAIVADIGGTTTDIGVLRQGFPRESSLISDIGSIRTNFRMPDVIALGLGGGSIVSDGEGVSVGPTSVGYQLTSKAMVFGGGVLTASDIAVASGYADFGDKSRVAFLDSVFVERAVQKMHEMLEDGIERMKTNPDPAPLILVGGGGVLIDRDLEGVSEIIKPDFAETANAVGASIAMMGAEIEKVVPMPQGQREEIIAELKKETIQELAKSGGDIDNISIADVETVPLPYVPGGVVRVRIKAVGDLKLQEKAA